MPVTLSADRTIAAGERLSFTNETAFQLSGRTLTVNGELIVVDAPANYTGGTILAAQGSGVLVVGQTGVVRVTAQEYSRAAQGVFGVGTVTNHGLFEVSGVQSARALSGSDSGAALVNTGTIRVTAPSGDGVGLHSPNGGSVNNSGLIEVVARDRAQAIWASSYGGTFVNSGTIRAVDSNASWLSIAVEWGSGTVTNAGVLTGEYALVGRAITVTNTGQMNGIVSIGGDFDHEVSRLTNSGLITGAVRLGGSADTYIGTGGTLQGVLYAGGGGDRLVGGAGAETLNGEAGADTIDGGGGADVLDGGEGSDVLSYASRTAGVAVTFGAISGVSGFEALQGSAFGDTLTGSAAGERLLGEAGADSLDGAAGADSLVGGADADSLTGGDGADLFFIGAGEAPAATAPDRILDWSADDRLVFAGGGLAGGTYYEETADDYATALRIANAVIGSGGANFVAVAVGADVVVFADSANNNGLADDAVVLVGRGLGDIGPGQFAATSPLTTPTPGPTTLTVPAFPAPPAFAGVRSTTAAVAGDMDRVNLEMFVDAVSATATRIRFEGAGATFTVDGAFTYDSFGDLSGGTISGMNLQLATPPFSLEVQVAQGVTRTATTIDDTPASIFQALFSGADALTGSAGADLIRAYDGADLITGRGGGDTLWGGLGNDVIYADGAGVSSTAATYLRGEWGDDYMVGAAGFDDLHGNQGRDTVSGGAGGDWVVGGQDADLLFGDEGDDIVYGNLGQDTCVGGVGNDVIRGGQQDDILDGGAGNDWLSGDRGNDTMAGGAGADVFHGSQDAGIDRVLDFSVAEGDRVQLDPGTTYSVVQQGGDTIIDMGAGHQMVLVGVTLSSLPPGWIFGA